MTNTLRSMTAHYPFLSLHVAGHWLSTASGGERPVINPADQSVLARLPLAGPGELAAAAESARPP